MPFHALPAEIHWQIIRWTCEDTWSRNKPWKPLSLVCPAWRELAQSIPRSKDFHIWSRGFRYVSLDDIKYVERSLVNNPKIWPTRGELCLKVDTVEDIQIFWQWLSRMSTDLVKLVTLRVMSLEEQGSVLSGLRDLPTTSLLGLYLYDPMCVDNASLLVLLRSCPKLAKVLSFNLREARPRDSIFGHQNSLSDACSIIEYLQTTNITTLDLTLQRVQLVDGHEKEPCLPFRENLIASTFYKALMVLSTKLRTFNFRGRCPRDLFRLCDPDCSWPYLEIMTIEFDIVDPDGRFWVDCSGPPERSSDIAGDGWRYEGPVDEDTELYYVNMVAPRGTKRQLWDRFLNDTASMIPHMPKLKFLAVGCNRGVWRTRFEPDGPLHHASLNFLILDIFAHEDLFDEWQLWGLIFLPRFPVDEDLYEEMFLPLKDSGGPEGELEFKILHTKEYAPSRTLLKCLENKHGRLSTTVWENLEVVIGTQVTKVTAPSSASFWQDVR